QLLSLGKPNSGERATFFVFLSAVFFWVMQPLLSRWIPNLSDPMIAIAAALLLFVIPTRSDRQRFVLVWENTKDIPWGVLLLFGGGLSLADAVATNGVAEFFGAFAAKFAGVPSIVLVL